MLSYLGEYSISTVSLYVLLISVNTTSLCPIIQASKLTCERSKYNTKNIKEFSTADNNPEYYTESFK